MIDSEAPADNAAVAKQRTNHFGTRIRADIVILRLFAKQQIAHAAAHQKRAVTVAQKTPHDLEAIGVDKLSRYRMLLARQHHRTAGQRGEYRDIALVGAARTATI